jgi:8-oxo-dGTP pyrophosphatase MutT (NUDIX family)
LRFKTQAVRLKYQGDCREIDPERLFLLNRIVTGAHFMVYKKYLAAGIKSFPPLRWGLSLGMRLFAPKNYVGAVGVIFNDDGLVLLVEHVFRADFSWGLPGGWVNQGENPALAVQREIAEELNLAVEVRRILMCVPQGVDPHSIIPAGLGLAYFCRLHGEIPAGAQEKAEMAYEILSTAWVKPEEISVKMPPWQYEAIRLGREEFMREQQHE